MKPVHALHAIVDAVPPALLAAALAAAVLQAAPARAQDRADIDRTQIIGNRELPKVLYIAPWKRPVPGELSGRPLASVLDEALAPIDRDVFRRTVQYDTQARSIVNPSGGIGALAGAPGAPGAPASPASPAVPGASPTAATAAPSAPPAAQATAPAAPAALATAAAPAAAQR